MFFVSIRFTISRTAFPRRCTEPFTTSVAPNSLRAPAASSTLRRRTSLAGTTHSDCGPMSRFESLLVRLSISPSTTAAFDASPPSDSAAAPRRASPRDRTVPAAAGPPERRPDRPAARQAAIAIEAIPPPRVRAAQRRPRSLYGEALAMYPSALGRHAARGHRGPARLQSFEILDELAGVLVALCRLLGQRAINDRLQLRRDIPHRSRGRMHDRVEPRRENSRPRTARAPSASRTA